MAAARALVAEATQLTEAAGWATPLCHPDMPEGYNAEHRAMVLRSLHGGQCLVGQVFMVTGKLEAAKAALLPGVAGWVALAADEEVAVGDKLGILGDIFMMQTEAAAGT